ncbi:MAG: phenylacetate--CoA ligase family protein [Bacteroidales bacterium]|nr:phenylacetate--CoA ligase family protein [Bacteroidales bacterium]MBR4498054.1 phenylacetate--CoA ligase family protein [Bacteroidales bacterium]
MSISDYIKKELPKWPNWINLILLRLNVFGDWVYGRSYQTIRSNIKEVSPEKKLIEITNYAIKNVPYYRNKYNELRIHSKEEFEQKIGFIDKEEVMSHWEEFLVDNIDWHKVVKGTTGGTSGKPLQLVTPKNRYIRESVFINHHRSATGWKPGVCRAVIRNDRLPEGRDYLVNPIQKFFIFDSFRMDSTYAQKVYNIIKRNKIQYIHAYPSGVYQFFKLCEEQSLNLGFIKAVMLSSEALTDEQVWYFTKHLGIKISCSYGHSEKLILAMNNCKDMILHVDPYYGYCEIIDEKGNPIRDKQKIGEMVGTTFSNKYQVLIRYKTGDYAEIEQCVKNNEGVEMLSLNKIEGRWKINRVYKRNGTYTTLTAMNLHGEFYNHINGMQYLQEEKGKLIVLIIKNNQYTSRDEDFIIEHLGNAMGGKQYVEIRYVEQLIFQPNGKFLPLISYIK